MSDEYYIEPRHYYSIGLVIMALLMTMIIGGLAAWVYFGAQSTGYIAPQANDMVTAAMLTCGSLWALALLGFYFEVRSFRKRDAIPLVHERMMVESRNLCKREYTAISDSGIAYKVLDEEAFSKLTPGTRVTAIVKHYPKEDKKCPIIVRTISNEE